MEISDAMKICFKNGIKIYPINTITGWIIEYTINGKPYKFDKVLNDNKEKNIAVAKSYIYLAEKYG
jgi:hypothetical protein